MRSWEEFGKTRAVGPWAGSVDTPCRERRLFYHYSKIVYVEFAAYGDVGVVTCTDDNGGLGQLEFGLAELQERELQCEALGFRRIGAWHHDEDFGVVRTYVNEKERVSFRINGTKLDIENEVMEFDTREAAVAEAERWIAELLADDYFLKRMRTVRSYGNPPRVDALALPTLTALPAPATPHEAVDLAVSRLQELHELFPDANMVMELAEADNDRLENFPELDENSWQWQRLGRWLDVPKVDPQPSSSFDYLIEQYGTLSWFLAGDWPLPDDVYTHRSNGHAGPTTPLEILPAQTFPLLEDLAKYEDEPDYLKLKLFMCDEECNGYAFDTRFATDAGEYLIVWFEGHDGPALEGDESDEIQPFGYWLLEQVEKLSAQLLPWLVTVHGPGVNASIEASDAGVADDDGATGKTYLEYRDEKSSKFWEIEVDGASHTVRYGRIGTDGRALTKEFDSAQEAEASAEKLIASKRKKGYLDATEG